MALVDSCCSAKEIDMWADTIALTSVLYLDWQALERRALLAIVHISSECHEEMNYRDVAHGRGHSRRKPTISMSRPSTADAGQSLLAQKAQ